MHRQREARRPAGDQGRRAAANPILILAGETGVAPARRHEAPAARWARRG